MDNERHGPNRRSLLRMGAGGLAALSAPGWLTGCTNGATELGPSGPTGAPVRGGTLTVGVVSGGQLETIAVPKLLNAADLCRAAQLYEPLFKLTGDSLTEPWLAESADPNRDASAWTIRLRDGVEWHDGSPLTAADVVYTLRSWQDASSSMSYVATQIVDFAGVRTTGEKTVLVPLLRSVAEFPSLLTLPWAYVIRDGFVDFDTPMGTGPFRFESFIAGQRSEFTANRDWWRAEGPYVDRIVVDSSYPSEDSRVSALLAGNIEVAPGFPSISAAALERNGKIRIGSAEGSGFQAITARVDQQPFTTPDVLEALKLLVDRREMVDNVFNGFATPGTDVPGQGLKYWAADLQRDQDIDKAKFLLARSGQQDMSLALETSAAYPGFIEGATLFAQHAERAGLAVQIERIDPALYYGDSYLRRPFSTNLWLPNASLTSWYLQACHTSAPYNETGWASPDTDELLFDAIGELDEARATEKWRAVQQLQLERGGYIVYGNPHMIDGFDLRVAGVDTTPAGNCNFYDFSGAWLA